MAVRAKRLAPSGSGQPCGHTVMVPAELAAAASAMAWAITRWQRCSTRSRVSPSGQVAPVRPARHGTADLGGGDAFIGAVIPLLKVVAVDGLAGQTGQLAGAQGPLSSGADQHRREAIAGQERFQGTALPPPLPAAGADRFGRYGGHCEPRRWRHDAAATVPEGDARRSWSSPWGRRSGAHLKPVFAGDRDLAGHHPVERP